MLFPRLLVPGLAAALAVAALPSAAAAQFDVWSVSGGRVALHFHESVLESAGLALIEVQTTAATFDSLTEQTEVPLAGFAIDGSSNLLFLTGADSGFVPYGILSGSLRALGGFRLVATDTGRSVDFHDFSVHPFVVRNDGPGGAPDPDYFALSAWSASGVPDNDLLFRDVKVQFAMEGIAYPGAGPGDHAQPLLVIKAWDLHVSPVLARKLGRPDLAGVVIATGKVEGHANLWPGGWQYPEGQNPFSPYASNAGPGDAGTPGDAPIDVRLGLLSGIVSLGHVGPFGTGRVGLSMSTTSCNAGTSQVPWLAPMNENHPGIAMQLYRKSGLRFEQVGTSWIKHGFFALANSQCTPCQGGSAQGKFLGVGCSDTYGTSNNGDRFYLGPRSEWNGFINTWTCLGSWFDGIPVDCVRSQNGNGLNSVDHRLEAFDADLNNPGAEYFYEAMYMVQQDTDIHNNIGSRRCTMVPNGSNNGWVFSTPLTSNPLLEGPALQRYGELRTQAGLAPLNGEVILAVQTADLGGGQWRYEYALFNWTLDRKVRSFSVPTGGGSVSDFYFHDIDALPANDWVPVASNGNLTWTFPDVNLAGHKVGGALEFGTIYNFGFTSDVAPGTRNAGMGIHEAGPGGDLLGASTLAPAGLNLSASKLAPAPGEVFDLQFRGGTQFAMAALINVGGVNLPAPVLIGPIAFDGNGAVNVTLAIPAELAGLTFTFAGGEVSTGPLQLEQLANLLTIEVQ